MSVLYDFHVQLVVLYRGVLYKKELRVFNNNGEKNEMKVSRFEAEYESNFRTEVFMA